MNRSLIYTLSLLLLSNLSLLHGQGSAPTLTKEQSFDLTGEHYRQAIQNYAQTIEANWQSGVLRSGDYEMPFEYYISGDLPDKGYPLYISLHGGGGAPAEANDQQWENQKGLYGAVEGLYFVPRAPTNTWNMWHQEYMEDFLLQIVTYSVARLKVDYSRVYLLGYSAGGDGVYNLATRLSDRFAAAAMMAGHPGDAQIENLRNLPFSIHVGAEDTAYNRAGLAVEWLRNYERLNGEDSNGFWYNINIYADKGHWMDGLDGSAIGWLAGYRRAYNPERIIWIQDDVLNTRRRNLEVSNPQVGFKIEQIVDFTTNTIYINSEHYNEVTIWLDDFIADLNKPVIVMFNGREVFNGMVYRYEQNIIDSTNARLDLAYIYWGKITVRR